MTTSSGYDLTPPTAAEHERMIADLTAERRVILHHGTEPPFCGGFLKEKSPGVYACRVCRLPLFRSSTKFESGTGWPSFFEPFHPTHVREIVDRSHGMARTEIRCAKCDGHLGHVFDDGPRPTGLRYCLNSASLQFLSE